MGDTSNQMNTTDKAKKGTGVLDKVAERLNIKKGKGKKTIADQAVAQTFADKLIELDDSLEKMIAQKKSDLQTEGKSEESYNRRAIETLEKMDENVNNLLELVIDYKNLRGS